MGTQVSVHISVQMTMNINKQIRVTEELARIFPDRQLTAIILKQHQLSLSSTWFPWSLTVLLVKADSYHHKETLQLCNL